MYAVACLADGRPVRTLCHEHPQQTVSRAMQQFVAAAKHMSQLMPCDECRCGHMLSVRLTCVAWKVKCLVLEPAAPKSHSF